MPLSRKPLLFYEDARFLGHNAIDDEQLALCIFLDRTATLRSMPSLPLLERRLTTATYRGLAILDLGCGSAAAGVLLAQTISGCQAVVAEVGGPGRLAKLNLRASIPATRSCLTLANMPPETVLLRERMARQLDIIVMTRQGLQENRFWFVMNTAKLLTAH